MQNSDQSKSWEWGMESSENDSVQQPEHRVS